MQSISASSFRRNLIQRNIRISSLWITQNNPTTLRRLSGNVVKRFLPESEHLVELVTIYNDGTYFHALPTLPYQTLAYKIYALCE